MKHQPTPAPEEKALLVFVNEDPGDDHYQEAELEGLCEAALLVPCATLRQRLDRPHKPTYIGKGKVEELGASVLEAQPDIVIFDCELSGLQIRNLTDAVKCAVVDRTQLILDIFSRRARTREGMLQVELAQMSYMKPRLMSVYTKFERQKGGIGMRGPGETKLETDRRMVDDKISRLKEEIEDVRRQRASQRLQRRKHPFPFATIVGYTSAGKSTLMNRLCGTELLVDAMPFATLDPTTRKLDLPDGYSLFITDTVGFIRKLPTHLVAAFRATLEEVTSSDFILHVVDVSAEEWDVQRDAVHETLDALGALDKPTITVFNKCDAVEDPTLLRRLVADFPDSVAISALTGEGIPDLLNMIRRSVQNHLGMITAFLPYSQSGLVEKCHRFGRVHEVDYQADGILIKAELVEEMRGVLAQYVVP
ncbi:MAG: GTPase HflX [Armatimonadetes bacterium]|nr:GTPase HflX [Armatimonadota bacterium]